MDVITASIVLAYKLMSLRTIWPALIFAASRNDSVSGRTAILVVSIRIRNGLSHVGAPSGSKCAIVALGLSIILEQIIDNHSGSPNVKVNSRWLDRDIVYGLSPIKLIKMISRKKEVRIVVNPLMDTALVRASCWYIKSVIMLLIVDIRLIVQ
jgi:hypothetical protein